MAKHWPFDPGMVSERQGKHVMRGTHAQPSKMTDWWSKTKTDDKLPARGPKATNARSIDQNQRMNSAIASKPTRGGGVQGSKQTPKAGAIDQDQKPDYPRLGKGGKRRGGVPAKLRGTKSNPSGPMYGGPNSRP